MLRKIKKDEKRFMKKRYKKSFRTKKKKSVISFPKSILKNKFFWTGFLFLIFGGGLCYLLFFSSIFQIKEIKVAQTNKVSSEEIKNAVWQKVNRNILLANFNQIVNELLERYPQLENIQIKRKLPNKLEVQIQEREMVAVLKKKDFLFKIKPAFSSFGNFSKKESQEYYLIDKGGVVFEKISDIPPDVLRIKKQIRSGDISLGKQYIEKEIMRKILEIKNEEEVTIKEITVISEERLNAKTTESWEIYFSLKKDLGLQLTELDVLLKEKLSFQEREDLKYIDLRFGKIYFKKSN